MSKPRSDDPSGSVRRLPFQTEAEEDKLQLQLSKRGTGSTNTELSVGLLRPNEQLLAADTNRSTAAARHTKEASRKIGLTQDMSSALIQQDEPLSIPDDPKVKREDPKVKRASKPPPLSMIEHDDTITSMYEQRRGDQLANRQNRNATTVPLALTDDAIVPDSPSRPRSPIEDYVQETSDSTIPYQSTNDARNSEEDRLDRGTLTPPVDLAVAQLAEPDPEPGQVAEIVEPTDEEHQKRRRNTVLSASLLVVVALAVAMVIVFGTGRGGTPDADNGGTVSPTDTAEPSHQPSDAPTPIPSKSPSSPPTTLLELELLTEIQSLSPTTTFSNATSPQSLALDWLLNDSYSVAVNREIQIQRFALAAFWYSTGGPNTWTNDPPWLTPTPECEWLSDEDLSDTRLACDGSGFVSAISVTVPDVAGTLPEELILLTRLESISLLSNLLVGTIPTSIGLWTTLERLIISNNNVQGTLPTEIGQLTLLTHLILNRNRLEGEVPVQLSSLRLLDVLNLEGNQLSGTIPASICQQGLSSVSVDCEEVLCDCCCESQ